MESINAVSRQAEAVIQPFLRNPYIMAVLKITLALYAAQLAPKLPSSVSVVFSNTFAKIIAVALIGYLANFDFQLAVMMAIVFVVGANVLSGRGILESFSDFSTDYEVTGSSKLIEPKTAVYPGCHNVTVADLEKAFDGDNAKMQTTVEYAYHELLNQAANKSTKESLMNMAYAVGLPHNIKVSEETAPYIATLLMYHGFNIGDTCVPPQ
jgi:hypothetical protein